MYFVMCKFIHMHICIFDAQYNSNLYYFVHLADSRCLAFFRNVYID